MLLLCSSFLPSLLYPPLSSPFLFVFVNSLLSDQAVKYRISSSNLDLLYRNDKLTDWAPHCRLLKTLFSFKITIASFFFVKPCFYFHVIYKAFWQTFVCLWPFHNATLVLMSHTVKTSGHQHFSTSLRLETPNLATAHPESWCIWVYKAKNSVLNYLIWHRTQ